MTNNARNVLTRLLGDESGVTMLEYTILLGIITIAVIGSVITMGTWVSTKWSTLVSTTSGL